MTTTHQPLQRRRHRRTTGTNPPATAPPPALRLPLRPPPLVLLAEVLRLHALPRRFYELPLILPQQRLPQCLPNSCLLEPLLPTRRILSLAALPQHMICHLTDPMGALAAVATTITRWAHKIASGQPLHLCRPSPSPERGTTWTKLRVWRALPPRLRLRPTPSPSLLRVGVLPLRTLRVRRWAAPLLCFRGPIEVMHSRQTRRAATSQQLLRRPQEQLPRPHPFRLRVGSADLTPTPRILGLLPQPRNLCWTAACLQHRHPRSESMNSARVITARSQNILRSV